METDDKKTNSVKKISAIVLAAGKGTRMHSDVQKQYMLVHGKPVLYYSLKAFTDSAVDEIIIVTGAADVADVKENIVDKYGFSKVKTVIPGGKERYDSTYAGLQACEDSDYVLIHDAARPMITPAVIQKAIDGAKEHDAIVIGVRAKDTIRIANDRDYAMHTPPRKDLWIVQTPQAFSYPLLRKAFDSMIQDIPERKAYVTDDAMVAETYARTKIKMIEGEYTNIKITTPEDILLAERFLEA